MRLRFARAFAPFLAVAAMLCGAAACSKSGAGKIRVAYVTNGSVSFWTLAAAGAKKAGVDLGVDVDVRMPETPTDQQRVIEELVNLGIDGIALSPIDGKNQAAMIDEACSRTHFILHDSDAPGTKRRCFVGVDNYEAGRAAGKLVKEALPSGGKFQLFIGRLGQDNAIKRCQGVIDEVFGWTYDPARQTSQDEVVQEDGYHFLGIRVDGFDEAQAMRLAEASLQQVPDLGCMVGLFAYNTPAILEALRDAGKLGQVKVVAFDEADASLQGILDGHVIGTVAQKPYEYGYESVRLLKELKQGQTDKLPADGFLRVPFTVVKQGNAQGFWDALKAQLAAAKSSG
ncbi:MAG: substrate-binding domain-containing protein [Planctomycetes bacterium]|nr:substrate-binding domain-containing protein [Planctomycetota bacterium]